jgi:phage baseplate assembly protein V
MSDEELSREALYGVYRAVVTDIRDPEVRGRVNVRLETGQEAWAELATLPAGDGYGTWLRPDPDDEVLLAFEGGDPRRPYVLGALWGRGDRPPETGEGAATVKTIRTRCGATITIDDARCEVRVEAPGGIRLVTGSRLEAASSQVAFDTNQFRVNAGMVEFSGVVRCDTLIANSVVASSYTPAQGKLGESDR